MRANASWETVLEEKYTSHLFLIRKKVVPTKTPHLFKLIIRFVAQRKNGTALFLVRDGYIVKPCRKCDVRYLMYAYRAGYKPSLRSRNLGELFKKYDIPKSVGKILVEHSNSYGQRFSIHSFCRSYEKLLVFFEGSVENLCKVVSSSPYFYRNYESLDTALIVTHFSGKRKLDFYCSPYMRDITWEYDSLRLFTPELLEGFDWTQSIEEIHRSLTNLEKKRRNPDFNTKIPYIEKTEGDVSMANELLGGQLTLKLSENGEELALWGNHLHHCIGSYTRQALSSAKDESLILLGVYEPNKDMPTWCIEMRRLRGLWSILQFRGLFNRSAPQETIDLVQKELNNATVKKGVLSYSS